MDKLVLKLFTIHESNVYYFNTDIPNKLFILIVFTLTLNYPLWNEIVQQQGAVTKLY